MKKLIILLCLLLLSSCGKKEENLVENLRKQIKQDSFVDLNEKLETYLKIEEIDILSKEEYDEIINIYEELDDKLNAYNFQIKKYSLYPSKEEINKLENYIIPVDLKDCEELLIENADLKEIKDEYLNIINNEEFINKFRFEEGIINKKSIYSNDNITLQIKVDSLMTEILKVDNNEFIYFKYINDIGSEIYKGKILNNEVNGEFEYLKFDENDNEIRNIKGTIKDSLLINDIELVVNNKTYQGTLNEDGHILTKQHSSTKKLIYAYDSKNSSYLYVEDASIAEFVMDTDYFDLPKLEIW